MAKSKHRLRKGRKSKRSSPRGANAKLAPKKIETIKPRNKAVTALCSEADFIKSKVLKIFAAFKAVAKAAKEIWRKSAVPIKVAAVAVNAKHIKAVAVFKAVSASMKTKWFPIAGITFWNYIIAPVLAAVIVMRSRLRYMAAALLLIALPAVVITMIAVYSPSAESSGEVPVILAANNADDNKASDAAKAAEVNAEIQGEPLDDENETGLNVTTLACVAVIVILTALALWVVIPRKSDPLVSFEDIKNKEK